MKVIEEISVKKQIVVATLLVTVVSIILSITSFIWSVNAADAQVEEATRILDSAAELSKSALNERIQGDLQTLITLAEYMSVTGELDDDMLLSTIKAVNFQNQFIRMGIVRDNKKGDFVDIKGRTYQQRDVSDNETILKALEGNTAVSAIYYDSELDERVNQYAVPIYGKGKVIGALTATNEASVLEGIVNVPIFSGQGKVHLIDHAGNFIIRSRDPFIQEIQENVFDKGYLSPEKTEQILAAMNRGQDIGTQVEYKGTVYELDFKALGANKWYVFCVAPKAALGGSLRSVMSVLQKSFYVIILLIVLLVVFIFRIIWNNNSIITKMAYFDSLTGAYNRERFASLERRCFSASKEYVLVLLNIEKFKMINELFGVQRGDDLLRYMKQACDKAVHEGELFCRVEGDRFALLLEQDSEENIRERLYKLMSEISSFSLSDNQNYKILCSCGVKYIAAEEKETDLNIQMNWVELALREAMGYHENAIVFYDETMHKKLQLRSEIENGMDQALKDCHFLMRLQPKIDLRTGKLHSAEALVRWERKDGTLFYPDQFIPIFEQNGFCVKLDMYMLETACQKLREWMDRGYPAVPISVNQSRLLFYKKTYLNQLEEIISKYEISPSMIILEVTEGLAMSNEEEMKTLIEEMHKIGFAVSMDDFGSGYSSLNSLKDFMIDELKLDKAFLDESVNIKRRDLIMKNVAQLARDLNIVTVVEGIETEEQEKLVKELQCDIGQGYFYAKPLTTEEFEKRYFTF